AAAYTVKPSAASRRAVAAPMPDEAPVTIATLLLILPPFSPTGWLLGDRIWSELSTKQLVRLGWIMARDSTATKARIVEAATVEFSTYGLAGARVDRIAERAGANKQLLYAYFGSKEALFDATMTAHLARFLEDVPFDADDLPGYAVAMFDFGQAHP